MRHSYKYVFAAIASLSWLSSGPAARGAVIGTYSDRPTWQGLTSGRTDIDFESLGLSQGGYTSYSTSAGLTIGGIQFKGWTGSADFLYALNPPENVDEDFDSFTLLKGPEFRTGSYLQALMPANVTSFGLDLMTMLPAGGSFRIQLDGVDLGLVITTQSRPNRTFFGVRTDTPFTDVKILLNGSPNNTTLSLIDNIAYGMASFSSGGGGGGSESPSETPEATTMLYVATGAGLLTWARRRRSVAVAGATSA